MFSQLHTSNHLTPRAVKWPWLAPQHPSPGTEGTITILSSSQRCLALTFWEGSRSENNYRSIYHRVNTQPWSSIYI